MQSDFNSLKSYFSEVINSMTRNDGSLFYKRFSDSSVNDQEEEFRECSKIIGSEKEII